MDREGEVGAVMCPSFEYTRFEATFYDARSGFEALDDGCD